MRSLRNALSGLGVRIARPAACSFVSIGHAVRCISARRAADLTAACCRAALSRSLPGAFPEPSLQVRPKEEEEWKVPLKPSVVARAPSIGGVDRRESALAKRLRLQQFHDLVTEPRSC